MRYRKLKLNIRQWLLDQGIDFQEIPTDKGIELRINECRVCGQPCSLNDGIRSDEQKRCFKFMFRSIG